MYFHTTEMRDVTTSNERYRGHKRYKTQVAFLKFVVVENQFHATVPVNPDMVLDSKKSFMMIKHSKKC